MHVILLTQHANGDNVCRYDTDSIKLTCFTKISLPFAEHDDKRDMHCLYFQQPGIQMLCIGGIETGVCKSSQQDLFLRPGASVSEPSLPGLWCAEPCLESLVESGRLYYLLQSALPGQTDDSNVQVTRQITVSRIQQ